MLSRMERVRCSLGAAPARPGGRSETSRTLATKLSPPADGVTTMSTGTTPVRALGFRLHVPGRGGLQAGDEPPMSQPMRSARRRPNSHSAAGLADSILPSCPKVTMASATVSMTERTRCSLARSALVIVSARSMAPRRVEASVQTKPKMRRLPRPPPTRTKRRSRLVLAGVEGGRGGQVQGQGTAPHHHRRLPGQRLVAGARRGRERRGGVEEGLGAGRDPVVDLEVHLRGDGDGHGGDDVAGPDGRVDPALQAGAPLLHRGRQGPLAVDGREEHEARERPRHPRSAPDRT